MMAPLLPTPAPETTNGLAPKLSPLLVAVSLKSSVPPLVMVTVPLVAPSEPLLATTTVPAKMETLPVKSLVVAMVSVLLPSFTRLAAPLIFPGPVMV